MSGNYSKTKRESGPKIREYSEGVSVGMITSTGAHGLDGLLALLERCEVRSEKGSGARLRACSYLRDAKGALLQLGILEG